MSNSEARAAKGSGLSAAGIVIGVIGCVIITASSVYTALKMGALPWPTIFTSVVSLVLLRALGHRSLNEANVTQIIMSAGSMVAGGLAFTIPGIWMLGHAQEVEPLQILLVALAGTLLGLVFTALIRKRMIEESDLEFPIGVAAAETLTATQAGGRIGVKLFGSMGIAGLWTVARDVLGLIPTMLLALPIPGVAFGIYNSPMLLSVGFLVGGIAMAFWFGAAVFANFGIVVGGSAVGLWDVTTAQGIVSSLGMGLMMGAGVGVVVHDIIPKMARYLRSSNKSDADKGDEAVSTPGLSRKETGLLALLVAAAALLVCFGLGLSPWVSVVVVLLGYVTTIMSAQSVGQTGIDPMEIFGLIVLLAAAALGESSQVKLIFVAGVIAVACGLGGDVMSDFKTGHIIGSNAREMWLGQAIGALLGTLVSVVVMVALVSAYGVDAFGPGKEFVSAQASVVATMLSGIPSVPAFVVGIVAGIALQCLKLPAMMVGLGVYLPFYMSLTAPLGALVKVAYDRFRKTESDEDGIVIASGVLGGESVVGVILALITVAAALTAG